MNSMRLLYLCAFCIYATTHPHNRFSSIVTIDVQGSELSEPSNKNPLQIARIIAHNTKPEWIKDYNLEKEKNGLEVSDFMAFYFRKMFKYLLQSNGSIKIYQLMRIPFVGNILHSNFSEIAISIESEINRNEMHGIYQGLLSNQAKYYPFLSFLLNLQHSQNEPNRRFVVAVIIKENKTKCYPHSIIEVGCHQQSQKLPFDPVKICAILVKKHNLLSLIRTQRLTISNTSHHQNNSADGNNITFWFDANEILHSHKRSEIEKYGEQWIRNKYKQSDEWGFRFSIFCIAFMAVFFIINSTT